MAWVCTVLIPVIHELHALGKERATGVGGFGFVLELMRNGVFDDFAWIVSRLAGPIPEGQPEAMSGNDLHPILSPTSAARFRCWHRPFDGSQQ